MRMQSVINIVSLRYRDERAKISDLQDELRSIESVLAEALRTKGEKITLKDFDNLTMRKAELIEEIKLKTQYCEGISSTRELLMDLGFDTKVE